MQQRRARGWSWEPASEEGTLGLRKVWGLLQGPRRRKISGSEAAKRSWTMGTGAWPLATDDIEGTGE